MTRKTTLLGTLVVCATVVACGSSDVTIGSRAESGASGDAGTADAMAAAPQAPAAASDEVPTGPKGVGSFTLKVAPVRPGTTPLPGLFVVTWVQVHDDRPHPDPEVVYTAPFTGAETSITVPLDALALPHPTNLLCERACADESACPCLSTPRIGIAAMTVVHDTNGDGVVAVESTTGFTEPWIGTARTVLVWSATAHPPPAPWWFGKLFPEGIQRGLLPHGVVEPAKGKDTMVAPPSNDAATLHVCDTVDTAVCQPPYVGDFQ